MDTTNTAIVVLIAVAILAVGIVLYIQRQRSRRLRSHYGAEYIAAVDELGDRRKAEAELKQRERRVERFDLRPLRADEADRFAGRWRKVQAEFVDDPGGAVAAADALLAEVMHARGYPVSDFEQRAADLSVEHPKLVSDYRIAHEVALRHGRGEAGTEDLRRALIHYRDLFADLIEPADARRSPEPRSFREELHDERAARIRTDEEERAADDRTAREGRRAGPGPGRAPRF
jgi:hypothetical protein